jgi:glycosyltransferase involved in cell wall biosynthesis
MSDQLGVAVVEAEGLPAVSDAAVTAPALSVVIPLFNEAESLRALHAELRAALGPPDVAGGYELIFVDDGSTDGSAAILADLFAGDRGVLVIQFRRNFGKSAALAAGFAAARGRYVVTLDADLQDVPAAMPDLLAPLERDEADLVSGWKADRQDPLTKTVPSALFNRVVRAVSGVPLHDFNCGYKAYRQEVLAEVPLYGELHRYIPVLAHFRGFRVAEVRVPHRARRYGRSKFGPARFVRGFFDLLTVLFLTQYTRRPLHLFGQLGALTFAIGCAISAYLAFIKLVLGEPIGHRPLLTLGVLLIIVGTQFFVFGLLGEMIAHHARTSSSASDGPPRDYSIRRVLRHSPPGRYD